MAREKKLDLKRCYIPLLEDEDFEWRWEEELVLSVDKMWTDGYSPFKMAEIISRDPDEILILLIDRIRAGYLSARPGGILGTRN